MELIYLLLNDQLKSVSGAISTSLLTAQLICGDIDIMCIGIGSTHPNLSDRDIDKLALMGVSLSRSGDHSGEV
jgi:hypothetical protein